MECIQQGNPSEAEALAREVLMDHPDDPNILRVSGVALMRQGRLQEAAKHLSHSVDLAPDVADSHEQYGLALAALGQFDKAENALNKALELNPESGGIHAKLARLQAMQGKEEESQKSRDRMFELDPKMKEMREARKFQEEGRHAEARRLVKNMLREDPSDINALNLMGSICMAQSLYSDAEAFLRQAVGLAPDFAAAWHLLSMALKEQRRTEEAVDAMDEALSLEPMHAEWHSTMGNLLMVWGKEERALVSFNKALAIKPDHAGALLSRGHILKTIGDQDDAIRSYRASASVRPDLGEVYWSLANLKTFRFDDSEVANMQAQLDSDKISDEARIHFCYSLGKHYEDQEDYPKAFEYYSKGGASKREMVKYDPLQNSAHADKIIEVFTPEFIESRQSYGNPDPAPILIVGLPRSGSTLVEQILSSHSQIDGTAELPDLMHLGNATGRNRFDALQYPETLINMDATNATGLGKDYIENTFRHRHGAAFFTDKMPNNFPHIGFLHLILPNAKVIDARRHPLDSCFGTFKQLFAKGQPFSYDLFDLGQYYIDYIRLMEHWDQVLPGKVLRVQYEDNVADQETQARRMIEHCGLEWEDQVLRFYESDRAVKTASSEQVRQPIYNKSVNSWKRYETELADLIIILEDVLAKLPKHIERPQIPDY